MGNSTWSSTLLSWADAVDMGAGRKKVPSGDPQNRGGGGTAVGGQNEPGFKICLRATVYILEVLHGSKSETLFRRDLSLLLIQSSSSFTL